MTTVSWVKDLSCSVKELGSSVEELSSSGLNQRAGFGVVALPPMESGGAGLRPALRRAEEGAPECAAMDSQMCGTESGGAGLRPALREAEEGGLEARPSGVRR